MTHEEIIQMFQDDLNGISTSPLLFEPWMDGVLVHVERIYGVASTQAQNFRNLRSDYQQRKILANDNTLGLIVVDVATKAKVQIQNIIKDIQRDIKNTIAREKREAEIKQQNVQSTNYQQSVNVTPAVLKPKVGLGTKFRNFFSSISIGVWGIIIPVLFGLFYWIYSIGKDNGGANSEREINNLITDTTVLNKSIATLKDTIKLKNDTIDLVRKVNSDEMKISMKFYQLLPKNVRDSITSHYVHPNTSK